MSRNKTIQLSEEDRIKYSKNISTNPNNYLNKTINGDTFETLAQLPKEIFDLVIIDPPYNLTKNYDGEIFKEESKEEYKEFTRSYLELIKSLLKKDGSLYVCCDWKSSLIIEAELGKLFIIRNRITWQRDKGRGCKNNWKNSMEDVWFCTNSNNYTFNINDVKIRRRVLAPYRENGKPKDWNDKENYRDTHPSNFWDDITIPFWSMPENTTHPTQKPEKLIAKLILASSNKGDLVLDPFSGSGTSSVVCKKLGRNYVGIEKSLEYCLITEKRLDIEDDSIQGYDGVFYERNWKR